VFSSEHSILFAAAVHCLARQECRCLVVILEKQLRAVVIKKSRLPCILESPRIWVTRSLKVLLDFSLWCWNRWQRVLLERWTFIDWSMLI